MKLLCGLFYFVVALLYSYPALVYSAETCCPDDIKACAHHNRKTSADASVSDSKCTISIGGANASSVVPELNVLSICLAMFPYDNSSLDPNIFANNVIPLLASTSIPGLEIVSNGALSSSDPSNCMSMFESLQRRLDFTSNLSREISEDTYLEIEDCLSTGSSSSNTTCRRNDSEGTLSIEFESSLGRHVVTLPIVSGN